MKITFINVEASTLIKLILKLEDSESSRGDDLRGRKTDKIRTPRWLIYSWLVYLSLMLKRTKPKMTINFDIWKFWSITNSIKKITVIHGHPRVGSKFWDDDRTRPG